MQAKFLTLAAIIAAATHVAVAAPLRPVALAPVHPTRSFDAINSFIGNVAEDILGDHTAKRDVDARSITAIENFLGGLFDKRDGAELDARSLTAIGNLFHSLFGRSDMYVDTDTGIIYTDSEKRDLNEARSLTAIESFFSNLFGKRDGAELDARSLTAIGSFFSNLFGKRDELDERSIDAITNFLDEHFHIARSEDGQLNARSLTAIGNFFKNLFGRSELYVDTETGTLYADNSEKRDVSELDARSLTAIEDFIGGLFNKRDGAELDARSFTAIGNFFKSLFGRDELLSEMSARAIDDLE